MEEENPGGDFSDIDELYHIMRDVTVVVVAVNKLTSKVSLVVANNQFDDEIEIDGGLGTCSPPGGHLTRSSHGSFDPNEEFFEFDLMVNKKPGACCYWNLSLSEF